jgi:hypothetical protein
MTVIKKQKVIDGIKIISNLFIYVIRKLLSKDKSTERLLLEKVPMPCYIDVYYIEYYYELLTFLYNFETKEYLNYIIKGKYALFIDIGSNI